MIFGALTSCGKQDYNGEYCAEVDYYNPNTGTRSHYTLFVEAKKGDLVKLKFPNGWIDTNDFERISITSAGNASLTTNNGYLYKVKIIGPVDGCLDGATLAKSCKGYKADGSGCKRKTDNPSGYCWQHE
jgi:hypothetical protein